MSIPIASPPLDQRSIDLRLLIVEALVGGKRGHVGASFSLVEIVRVLFDDILSFRSDEPAWPERDRFILSKGHGTLALYAMLADKGFFSRAHLAKQCTPGALLGGHPETRVPGIEASTGALGHGLSIGVGVALALALQQRRQRVFVLMGDGELDEGSVWEASLSAAKHGLDALYAIIDYNKFQSYGPVESVLPLEPLAAKFEAFGYGVVEVDGHDVESLREVLSSGPIKRGKPTAIIAHTIKGKGISFAENAPLWHHKANIDRATGIALENAIREVASA